MEVDTPRINTDAVVVGAGISGVAAAKCLREAGHEVLLLERTSDVGGLWTFREDEWGVMSFTRINVSKYNYAFSDYPFPDDAPDFPHHTFMSKYIHDYVKHFGVDKLIRFNLEVINVEKKEDMWEVTARKTDVPESEVGDMESAPDSSTEKDKEKEKAKEGLTIEVNKDGVTVEKDGKDVTPESATTDAAEAAKDAEQKKEENGAKAEDNAQQKTEAAQPPEAAAAPAEEPKPEGEAEQAKEGGEETKKERGEEATPKEGEEPKKDGAGVEEVAKEGEQTVAKTGKGALESPAEDKVGEKGRAASKNLVVFVCKFVAIASGHHAIPSSPNFPGQDGFKGEIIHSSKYKDAKMNGVAGKRLLVVGIGNSGVDVATNAATEGGCAPVMLSSRSGAWVFPNYIFGYPIDLYACRAFLNMPWRFGTWITETILTWVQGNPKSVGLNPKMHALQTQPTVSSNLVNLLQRGDVKIVPNVQSMEGSTVRFSDGTVFDPEVIVLATGYKVALPFIKEEMRSKILVDPDNNDIRLYKNVFCPDVGHTLAFIGFVQPASGGLLTMSETQARWFAELTQGNVSLPGSNVMNKIIEKEIRENKDRYWGSPRHTIQREPILYNDEISDKFGAKPSMLKHPGLAPRLMFGSCGAAQWRLDGPGAWSGAEAQIRKVPVTDLMKWGIIGLLGLLFVFLCWCGIFFIILDDIMDWDIID